MTGHPLEPKREPLLAEMAKMEEGKAAPANGGSGGVSTTVKFGLLLAVVFQNAALNIAARRSRVTAAEVQEETGCGHKSTTVVVVIECVKVVVSIILYSIERGSALAFVEMAQITNSHRLESAKILVPAFLYVAQNNLLLVAADNLEGPVLALFGQLKIIATALFSVVLLRRTLGCRRWISLFVLTASIALVQISQMSSSSSGDGGGDEGSKNLPLGLAISVVVSTISGFSGVYFELVLKGSPISVWVRNLHLATFSTFVAVGAVLSNDYADVQRCGFFAGYRPVVWLYVAVQAGGGLLIAAVIKYADNILKAFATSVAIVVVSLVSAIFYSFALSQMFFAGALGVVYSVFLYGDLLKDLPLCRRCPICLGGKDCKNRA